MATPRHRLIDPQQAMYYHIVSRCVRRSWLCGVDSRTRRNYSHRKTWLIERMDQLAEAFPIEINAYAVMSNHFHLVVYYDPLAAQEWSNGEVVRRWLIACPPKNSSGQIDHDLMPIVTEQLLEQQERVEELRLRLGSLSTFMQLLKQPIARRANQEDECRGHFFEQRFYSGALLSQAAVLAAMAYVDLNPVRSKIAKSISECKHTSVARRMAQPDFEDALLEAVSPIVSGLERTSPLESSLSSYLSFLDSLILIEKRRASKPNRWQQWKAVLRRQQRAHGSAELIQLWLNNRSMQTREMPFA